MKGRVWVCARGKRSLENWPKAWNGRCEENKWRSRVCRPWNVWRETCCVIRRCLGSYPLQMKLVLRLSLLTTGAEPMLSEPQLLKMGVFQLIHCTLMSGPYPTSPSLCWPATVTFWSTALLSGLRGKWGRGVEERSTSKEKDWSKGDKGVVKWEGEREGGDLLYLGGVCACVYASGHADGIYIPPLGYVSLNSPYIPPAVSCPVQSSHFITLLAEAQTHRQMLTHIPLTHATIT